MLKCSKCGDMYKETKRKSTICLPCKRVSDKQWREARKAEGRPIKSIQLSKERRSEINKQYSQQPEVRAKRNADAKKRYRSPEFQKQIRARMEVWNAIRRGEVVAKPCEVCGASKAEAHHDNYDKPLDVRWMCRTHHVEFHAAVERSNESDLDKLR